MPLERPSRSWIAENRCYTLTGIREALGVTKMKFLNALKSPGADGYLTGAVRGQAFGIGAAVAAAVIVILGPKLKPPFRRPLFLDRRLRRYVLRLLSERPAARRQASWLVIRNDDLPAVTSRKPPWFSLSLNLDALTIGLFQKLTELARDPEWRARHVREPDQYEGGSPAESTASAIAWEDNAAD